MCSAASSKSWCGFKSHFSRYHRQNVDIQVNELLEDDSDIGHQIEVQQPKIKMECANFALKLQSRFKVPSSSIDDIIGSTINLIQTAKEARELNPQVSVTDALKELKTQKLCVCFYTNNCHYIAPQEVILGQRYAVRKGALQNINDYGYIIPFKENVQNFLNQPEVWEEVMSSHESDNGIMLDYCDGSFVKNNPFIQHNKPCLLFIINTDLVEIVNPIGAHVKKHKIDIFYWTLAYIRPNLRSRWNNIHLLGICKTQHLQNHGLANFLLDFMSNLISFQNGMELNVHGEDITMYGSFGCTC